MAQLGNLLLKLRREMMSYLWKLETVNTRPTSSKILCKSWYFNLLSGFLQFCAPSTIPSLSVILLSFWRLTSSPIRLQVDAISRLSSFVLEKQESDAVKKALTEARGRNEDLIRRNEDLLDRNDDLIKKIEELQETVQRYSFTITFSTLVIHMSKHALLCDYFWWNNCIHYTG